MTRQSYKSANARNRARIRASRPTNKLGKQPGCARGVYATPDWGYVLERVRGTWFLKHHGRLLGHWTGAIADALTWAQRYIDGAHTIDGVLL